mmetsp:Transcript_93758/g.148032  ORF Transcript_93758/g.148032 Transcript_93758/m.148032 type:complete len:370 (+) Transcript_93758:152-1261(+)
MVFQPFGQIDFTSYAFSSDETPQVPSYAHYAQLWEHTLGEASWAMHQSAFQTACACNFSQQPVSIGASTTQRDGCGRIANVVEEPAYVWNVEYLNKAPHRSFDAPEEVSSIGNQSADLPEGPPALLTGEKTPPLCGHFEQHETVTTAMVRNLPNQIKQSDVIRKLETTGFKASFNFCYVPSTFTTSKNKGYAFINFVSNAAYTRFLGAWHGKNIFGNDAVTTLNVTKAAIQGLELNVQRWGGPRIRRIRNPEFRPFVAQHATGSETQKEDVLALDALIPQKVASSWPECSLELPLSNQAFNFGDAGTSSNEDADSIDSQIASDSVATMVHPPGLSPGDDFILQHSELDIRAGQILPAPPGLSSLATDSF